MIQRILGRGEGRSDDTLEVLTKRLTIYRECTQPIANRFQDQGKLLQIDAEGDPEAIFNRIKEALHLA